MKFKKNIPKKRNYITAMNQNNTFHENKNRNEIAISHNERNNDSIFKNRNNLEIKNINNTNTVNNNNNEIIFQNNSNNNVSSHNNIINDNNNIRINDIGDNKNIKLSEREKERKKMELKTVDVVAQELLLSKDENDLREYLFDQLQLLDKKRRINLKFIQMENAINQLTKDHIELRRCNTGVTRALNKKYVENFNLDKKLNKLNNDINNVTRNINFHEYMGDCYKEELDKIKGNNVCE